MFRIKNVRNSTVSKPLPNLYNNIVEPIIKNKKE